ncbi:tldD, putative modulator of DNA gyrase [Pyrobaculum aerophilum str. IM2]|uniref:TldD/PmbA family protein n=2 Tax=Pyrobaculum aerophilum TaxID=13773 RepID=A0A832STG8_9CREN|nr:MULTISPECIES: TldD/PmbA family protein [Pyrobaculum]AAL64535.1 tldD, putative modulator of DNA gyrase [Pyrobaculum aerophilum str. IM2]HII47378.1 TldD/PmbA family protein [Pyrobaculum aerophilum]
MESLLYRALDYGLSQGASYVEIRWQRDSGSVAVMRNSHLEYSARYVNEGIAVRVVAGGGLGFAATSRIDAEEVFEAVENAIKLAKLAGRMRKTPVALSEEALARFSYHLPDIELEPVELLKTLDDYVDKSLSVRRLAANVWRTEKRIVTSDGADVYSKVPRVYVFAMLIKHEPSLGSLQRDVFLGGTSQDSITGAEKVLEEESKKLHTLLEKARAVPPGRYDIVFAPEMTGILVHESIGHPFELDRIYGREGAEAGESYIKPGNWGVKIGSDLVNITDNPAIPGTYGFYLVDDEGVVARPKRLVYRGVATEFIANRQYAAVIGSRSNAGARASLFDREPIPRMSNTYMEPGDWKPDEIIRDTRRGIYVVSYTEWNINDTRYSGRYGILEGYLIENGELKNPVKGFIEVDTPELWGNVDAVGKDFQLFVGTCGKGNPSQGIPVTMGGPTFRSRNLRVV